MKRPILLLSTLLLGTGFLLAQVAPAQVKPSPGGVKSPEVWFKTVPKYPGNLEDEYVWKDDSGDEVQFLDSDPAYTGDFEVPRSDIHTYNFHPALYFSGKNMNIELKKADLSQTTIVGLWGFKKANRRDDGFLYNVNREEGQEFLLTKKTVEHATADGREQLEYSPNFTGQPESNRISILTYCGGIRPNYSLWGRAKSSIINIGGILSAAHSSKYGIGVNNTDNEGYCPEFIVYNRVLSKEERLRVESYLAIKYGITINEAYLDSEGEEIWKESTYNNRVAGYMRDDKSGLNQLISTSSYDPSQVDIDDTYHEKNSNNKSAKENLLVMGRQNGEPMTNDREYVIFGDNGQSTAIRNEDKNKGTYDYKRMQRIWKVKTNIAEDQDAYMSAWTYDETESMRYSNSPLTGENGSFSFHSQVDNFQNYTPCVLKFGSQSSELVEGAPDYGYFMDARMRFYKIEQGRLSNVSLLTDHAQSYNSKVEICKEKNTIFLRINGVRIDGSDIQINTNHQNEAYYGNLTNNRIFSHSGFINSGNVVELSGGMTEDEVFDNYTNRNVYLLIDQSGTGNFAQGDTRYIQMDEFDAERSKIIFNNVFWNDGDLFTFAHSGYAKDTYQEPEQPDNFTVTQIDPTCDNNTAQSNGSIKIKFDGNYYSQFYYYATDGSISGDKYSDKITHDNTDNSYTITGLPASTYNLVMSKYSGISFDFTATDNNAIATAHGNNPLSEYYSVAWSVLDPRINATIAFASKDDLTTPLTGLKMSDGKLYVIRNGSVEEIGTLKVGELISFNISSEGYKNSGGGYQTGALAVFIGSVNSPGYVNPVYYDADQTLVVQVENGFTIPNLSFRGDFTVANPLAIWETENMEAVPVGVKEYNDIVLDAGCIPPSTDYKFPIQHPTCVNGQLQNDGVISIINGVYYTLINRDNLQEVASNLCNHDNCEITGLPAGTYQLITASAKGTNNFNFHGTDAGAQVVSKGKFNDNKSYSVEWTVSDLTTQAVVSLMFADNEYSPADFSYGVRIENDKLYTRIDHAEFAIPVTLNAGDRIRIERNGDNTLVFKRNGVEIDRKTVTNNNHKDKNTYIAVRALGSGISDLRLSSNFNFYDINTLWINSPAMTVTTGNSEVHTIVLQNSCLDTNPNAGCSLTFNVTGPGQFNANLTLPGPDNGIIYVYYPNGSLFIQRPFSTTANPMVQTFGVQVPGIYFVTVITNSGKMLSGKTPWVYQ